MTIANRLQAASRRPTTGAITEVASVEAMATGLRRVLGESTVRHGRSVSLPLKPSGNGSMHTGKSLESDGLISIETPRTWHRSTARNMLITIPEQKLDGWDRRRSHATGSLCKTIAVRQNPRELQNRRR